MIFEIIRIKIIILYLRVYYVLHVCEKKGRQRY